ncbi:hypothetical protein TREPR_0112 [Treponema primitia ZAS-2]|uniref:Alginate export domain-containing protein n=1 Tax=Treponema primitia (strain ATCC BAA-887 / DSM 12427 / ZAS-2) TaxID=545694 RepID=F5YN90_TREPZ|nr:hypothetical protein [Treponema primitia]AEF85365.1 hypothetical protein TREPR_0112 [Treponema primitia ZAS-2]
MKRLVFFALFAAIFSASAFSYDFGLVLDQGGKFSDDVNSYSAGFVPWFSWGTNEKLQLYFSGNLTIKYEGDDWHRPLPLFEIGRFEADYMLAPGTALKAGRIAYGDSSGLVASGLFDGVNGNLDWRLGRLFLGAYYTGLLYKETAEITMTGEDSFDYYAPWDADDMGSYFAPRRLLATLRYDIPGILGALNNLSLETIFQFDVSAHDNPLHSQYIEVGYALFPIRYFQVDLGLIVEGMESKAKNFQAAFAGYADVKMDIPGSLKDRFSLGIRVSSGKANDTVTAFNPINGNSMGMVFAPKFSSITVISGIYEARLLETLSLDFEARYFLRTDTSNTGYGGIIDSDSPGLGAEFYNSFIWAPLDDISCTLGGGVFFPGKAFASKTPVKWNISMGLILSL